jgi:hypothetical protein
MATGAEKVVAVGEDARVEIQDAHDALFGLGCWRGTSGEPPRIS